MNKSKTFDNQNNTFLLIIKKTLIILVLIWFSACSQVNNKNSNFEIKEKLNYPFGTVLKLKIEIIDGNDLEMKEFGGKYLLKILEINENKIQQPQIITFLDETGYFPSDDFGLYKLLYGKDTSNLSQELIINMNKNYVGKSYNVLAYETGCFSGEPINSEYVTKYVDTFNLARQDISFQFVNSIKITTKLNNEKNCR